MAKLHQILAVEKGERSRTERAIAQTDRTLSKAALLNGHTRSYRPKDADDTDRLPSESTLVQVRVKEQLQEAAEHLARLWDVVATKEYTNTKATANLQLADGTNLLENVPVTYLLFLDHQLINLHTLVSRLPILDAQYEWTWDPNTNCYRTAEQETHRTKKIPRVLTKAEPTDKHPAQTEVWYEDQIVGFWSATHLSGAIAAQDRQNMINRVEELQAAVKKAREAANDIQIDEAKVATKILAFILPEISLRGVSTASASESESA